MVMITTAGYIYRNKEVLLGFKKRGFGAGQWTGFGGKVKEDEDITACLKREIKEESSLDIKDNDIVKCGFVNFEFTDTGSSVDVHVFKIKSSQVEPLESEEMRPQWFNLDAIPYEAMWDDAKYWLPLVLEGKIVKAHFVYTGKKVMDYKISVVEKL